MTSVLSQFFKRHRRPFALAATVSRTGYPVFSIMDARGNGVFTIETSDATAKEARQLAERLLLACWPLRDGAKP